MPKPGLDGKYISGKKRSSLFRQSPKRARIPASLVILVLIGALFWLIPPAAQITEQTLQLPDFTLPPPTATLTPLPRPTDVHGGRIVFTCTRGDFNNLCMINADGTGLKTVVSNNTNNYYPVFSPQGDSIVYASLVNGSFDLFRLVLSTNKTFQLTSGVGNVFSPSFSPDGNRIAFLNRPSSGPAALWLMKSNGENPHLLYAGPNSMVAAAWSPLGDIIAFAMAVESDYAYQVFLLDVNQPKNPPRQVTRQRLDIGGSLAWSPDAKRLLIYAGPVGGREIYQLEVDTGDIVQLTFGGNNAAASYSPDGQYIVYNSLRNNGQADLFIMRADGHSTRQLTDDPEPDWQPQWTP